MWWLLLLFSHQRNAIYTSTLRRTLRGTTFRIFVLFPGNDSASEMTYVVSGGGRGLNSTHSLTPETSLTPTEFASDTPNWCLHPRLGTPVLYRSFLRAPVLPTH